jgi:hypothetical protein
MEQVDSQEQFCPNKCPKMLLLINNETVKDRLLQNGSPVMYLQGSRLIEEMVEPILSVLQLENARADLAIEEPTLCC